MRNFIIGIIAGALLVTPFLANASISVPWNRVQVGTIAPLYSADGILVNASSTFLSTLNVLGNLTAPNLFSYLFPSNATSTALSFSQGLFASTTSYFENIDALNGYKQNGSLVLYATSTNFDTFGGIGAGAGIIAMATSSDNTSGPYSTAFGYNALHACTTNCGYDNSAFGYKALAVNTSGYQNAAFGYNALVANTSGADNTAFGYRALPAVTTGTNNTGVGFQALTGLTSGGSNIGIGFSAGASITTGSSNVAIGLQAMRLPMTSSTGNTAVGYQADQGVGGNANSYNALFGINSGNNLSTGSNNTFFGSYTASTTSTGSNNIAIGYDVALPSTTGSNQLDIGNLIFGTGINGEGTNISTGNVGIGSTTPGYNLVVGSQSGSASTLALDNGNGNITSLSTLSTGAVNFSTAVAHTINFIQGATNTLVLSSTGNLLVGTGSPLNKLSVLGDASVGADYNVAAPANGLIVEGNVGIGTSTPYSKLSVWGANATAGVHAMEVTNSASSTLFAVDNDGQINLNTLKYNSCTALTTSAGVLTCTVSDQNVKENITPVEPVKALQAVLALDPVTFTYKQGVDTPGIKVGLIAQQVAPILPGFVSTTSPTKYTPNGTEQIDPNQFPGLYAAAIQGLQQEINALASGSVKVTAVPVRSAEENWQWGALLLLVVWNVLLTIKKKNK